MQTDTAVHNRRYVGLTETLTYVLFDGSKSFNIDKWKERFMLDVVKIDFGLRAIGSFAEGIWDIVNDSFAGVLVDRTMTRWGRFKPYLVAFALPGMLFSFLYWFTPYIFGQDPSSVPKFLYWYILSMTNELMLTFRGFAETGFIASISPNSDDKSRLYTVAELLSSIFENFPEIIMGLLIDLVNHKKISINLTQTYFGMGFGCGLICCLFAFSYALVAKERIVQSPKKPNLREGLKALMNNKPMLLIACSEAFNKIRLDTGETNYFVDVLGIGSFGTLINLPTLPWSFLTYAFLPWAQRTFSTRALWVFGSHNKDVTSIIIFLIGVLRGKGKNAVYKKPIPMYFAFLMKDFIYKSTMSVYKIVPRMMNIEALDYCEWKNGYRSEGTTLAVKGIILKLFGTVINALRSVLMKKIGYSLNAGFGKQTDKVKFNLFFCCTVLPGLTGLLGIVPKLFYDMSPDKRQMMYDDLTRMRKEKLENDYGADNNSASQT